MAQNSIPDQMRYCAERGYSLMQQHPVLLHQYEELMAAALKELSKINWVLDALTADKHTFAPWCKDFAPERVLGVLVPRGEGERDIICHRLSECNKPWIGILLHELRHLWQHAVMHADFTSEESIEYHDRPSEVDARAQESLVEMLDKQTVERLNEEARALDDAIGLAALGLYLDDDEI